MSRDKGPTGADPALLGVSRPCRHTGWLVVSSLFPWGSRPGTGSPLPPQPQPRFLTALGGVVSVQLSLCLSRPSALTWAGRHYPSQCTFISSPLCHMRSSLNEET